MQKTRSMKNLSKKMAYVKASLAMEGLQLPKKSEELLMRYGKGEISREDVIASFKEL